MAIRSIPEDISARIIPAFYPEGKKITQDDTGAMIKFIAYLRSDTPQRIYLA